MMPELKPFQKMLWKKAKDAGVTLPNDAGTADLTKPEIDRLVKGLEAGEDVFGSRAQSVTSSERALFGGPGFLDEVARIRRVLERIADRLDRS